MWLYLVLSFSVQNSFFLCTFIGLYLMKSTVLYTSKWNGRISLKSTFWLPITSVSILGTGDWRLSRQTCEMRSFRKTLTRHDDSLVVGLLVFGLKRKTTVLNWQNLNSSKSAEKPPLLFCLLVRYSARIMSHDVTLPNCVLHIIEHLINCDLAEKPPPQQGNFF